MKTCMRLYKRKGWFYVNYYRGKDQSLNTKDEALAKELFRALKADYLRGKLIHLEKVKRYTLKEFRNHYVENSRSGVSVQTLRKDNLSLRLLEDVVGSSTQVRAITATQIEEFKKACLARGVRPASVNSYLRHIKAALSYALDEGIIEKKPKIKMVPVGSPLPHVLSPEKINTLLASAKEADVDLWRYFMFCLWTGARRSEVLSLQWQNVSLRNRQCKLTGKGNRERIVPLLPPLIEILTPIQKDIGPVFPPHHADTYSHKFKKIAVLCGIKENHLHDLRHTAATFMLKSGIPLPVVQKILGHSQIATTQIYAKVLDEMMQSEMAKLRFE